MAKQGISTGTSPNDGTGDSLLGGAVKVNSNFDEVYGKLGDGTNLFVGIVSSIAVDGALSISTSYGAPTITGTANTAVINSRQIYTAGVSTFIGDVTAVGVNTFSSAGYDIAGIVTAQDAVLYDTVKVAGITTINSFGVNVGGAVTATTIAVRDTGDGSYVGLNTVTLDNTGIAATAININDTATLTNARITTATINSGIVTTVTVGAGGCQGAVGSNSVIAHPAGQLTAAGGGYGAGLWAAGGNGGKGCDTVGSLTLAIKILFAKQVPCPGVSKLVVLVQI